MEQLVVCRNYFSQFHMEVFLKQNLLQSVKVYEELGLIRLGQLMALPSEGLSTSIALLLHNMMNCITDFPKYKKAMDEFEELRKKREPTRRPQFKLGMVCYATAANVLGRLISIPSI